MQTAIIEITPERRFHKCSEEKVRPTRDNSIMFAA